LDRLFLDSNILYSAAHKPDGIVSQLWDLDDVELLTSTYALTEAVSNMETSKPKARLEKLTESLRVISIHPDFPLPRDITLPEKDQPILQAAISAHATHLLTGDFAHFRQYYRKRFSGVLILPPAEYLSLRSSR
jgi:predicted nucleic acid-binding protein